MEYESRELDSILEIIEYREKLDSEIITKFKEWVEFMIFSEESEVNRAESLGHKCYSKSCLSSYRQIRHVINSYSNLDKFTRWIDKRIVQLDLKYTTCVTRGNCNLYKISKKAIINAHKEAFEKIQALSNQGKCIGLVDYDTSFNTNREVTEDSVRSYNKINEIASNLVKIGGGIEGVKRNLPESNCQLKNLTWQNLVITF